MQPATDTGFHVVIVGAGYAGQMTAARLAQRRLPMRITVVDPSPVFVERIRLHQVAAGQPVRMRPMRALLPRRAELIQARAERIDPATRTVYLAGEDTPATLRYDALVYALGSTDDLDAVPGARRFAHGIGTRDATGAVRARVPELARRGGRIVVIGGGLTGIEAATELAEAHPGLALTVVTTGELGAGLHDRARAHLARVCERLGVARRGHTRVVEIEETRLRCADGSEIPFDLCLWAAGFRAPALARISGLPVDARDRVEVDATLRVRGHDGMFAAGDAATVIDGEIPIRMACATAIPMGVHAAGEIARALRGQEPQPFRFGYAIQCISLGRRDGIIQRVDAADRPTARVIRGRPGAWLKEAVCRFAAGVIRAERALGLPLYRWPRPGPGRSVPALAAPRDGQT